MLSRTRLEDATNDNGDILLLEDGTTSNDNISHEGGLLNEENDGSSPIIFEFFEPELGRVIGEDDSNIMVDVLSHDVLEILEYNGDFMVHYKCRTNQCEEIFGRSLIHFVRGCL